MANGTGNWAGSGRQVCGQGNNTNPTTPTPLAPTSGTAQDETQSRRSKILQKMNGGRTTSCLPPKIHKP